MARGSKRQAALLAALLAWAASGGCVPKSLQEEKLDPAAIARTLGGAGITKSEGKYDAEHGVYRVSVPRSNLRVSVAGTSLTPELGLTAWATISGTRKQALLLGNFPLTEDETDEFLKLALDSGMSVNSLHNRFLSDSPRILSVHFSQNGTEEALASNLAKLLGFLRAERPRSTKGATASVALDTSRGFENPQAVQEILGQGEIRDGVLQITQGRGVQVVNRDLGNAEGSRSWAAFAGTSERAVVNGDIATLEPELRETMQRLLKGGFRITSVHTHLIMESPRIVFVHFWGTGDAVKLAETLRDVLGITDSHQSN